MSKIRVLPANLANQIAAGEVVERPASVIKELIENSIDAGAKRVSVEIELGGRRLMRVSDNGIGMSQDDAILAFERHATSKIRTLEDLAKIATLGFRGEALASIASVAKVELITRTADAISATRVLIEGGSLIDVKDAARDIGSTISIRDLFFNTPARRKFMRSEATENYHLASIVTHYALANPEIAFSMTNNGRETLRVAPAKDLRERTFQLFGGAMLESLLPVAGGRDFVASVSGFVSAPRERRTNRDSQYFFVNNRYVRDKTIAGGLLEGFRSVLPHGVYPVAFLFVDVPLEEVDVNVHPAKIEVRFRRGEAVKDVVADAIRSSLARNGIGVGHSHSTAVATLESLDRESPVSLDAGSLHRATDENRADQNSFHLTDSSPDVSHRSELSETQATISEDISASFEKTARLRAEDSPTEFQIPGADEVGAELLIPPLNSAARFVNSVELDELNTAKIRPVAQLHDSYIIAVDDEGLLLIDQHVAHERILFDKFRLKETERPVESQNLLIPETVDLTPPQSEAYKIVEAEIGSLGFDVIQLSGRTVAIKSIPTDLPPAEARNLFSEILDTVEMEKRGRAKATFRDDIAASLACKAAVKVNMKLTPEKMQWLIDKLLTASSPTTCPHGRPVILRLSMKDIERGFHRT